MFFFPMPRHLSHFLCSVGSVLCIYSIGTTRLIASMWRSYRIWRDFIIAHSAVRLKRWSMSIAMHHFPFCVVKIDLRKAFNSFKQSLVGKILLDAIERGLSPLVAFALFSELSDRGARAHLPGCSSTLFLIWRRLARGLPTPRPLWTTKSRAGVSAPLRLDHFIFIDDVFR